MKALTERNNNFTYLKYMSLAHCVFPPSFKMAELKRKDSKQKIYLGDRAL